MVPTCRILMRLQTPAAVNVRPTSISGTVADGPRCRPSLLVRTSLFRATDQGDWLHVALAHQRSLLCTLAS